MPRARSTAYSLPNPPKSISMPAERDGGVLPMQLVKANQGQKRGHRLGEGRDPIRQISCSVVGPPSDINVPAESRWHSAGNRAMGRSLCLREWVGRCWVDRADDAVLVAAYFESIRQASRAAVSASSCASSKSSVSSSTSHGLAIARKVTATMPFSRGWSCNSEVCTRNAPHRP